MRVVRILLSLAVFVGSAAVASGQGNPTGTISGHVTDPDGQGFKTVKRTIGVKMAEIQPLNITFALAAVAESVTVAGQSPDVVLSSTVASNFKKEQLELLSVPARQFSFSAGFRF
jgi:hypothetical protein